MDTWLWRRVRLRLDRAVPPERSGAVIGDLQEDYARRRTAVGAVRANLWLWREARSLSRAYRAAAATPTKPWRPAAGFLSDVRFAMRRLRAAPAFAIFAVLTLALGIGATTAIYSLIRSALGPPSGVTTLDRLVTITHSRGALSYGDFHDLRTRQTAFQDVAGWGYQRFSIASGGNTATGWGELVTGEYFQVLGVQPALGRLLQPADETSGAPAVAVISHGLWQRVFGGSSDVLGRLMKVNGVLVEVVGVASQEFAGLFNNGRVPSNIWLPITAVRLLPSAGHAFDLSTANRSRRWVQVRARLKNDVTLDEARADVASIAQQLDRSLPLGDADARRSSYHYTRTWGIRRTADIRLNDGADRLAGPLAATAMGAVGLVLLVACTNLANLVLARGSGRREESAIRLALGASRSRLIRGELTESLLLAAAGGLAGIGVARTVLVLLGNEVAVGNNTFVRFVPELDGTVLVLSAGATFLSALVAGLLPAVQSSRADVRTALASGASSSALPRWRGRRALIAAQVTVSVVLIAIAGLCVGQIREQNRIHGGIDLERLALVEVDFSAQQYPEGRVRQIADAVLADVSRRPGVSASSVSSGLPIGIGTPGSYVGLTSDLTHRAEFVASTPGILTTLGMRVVKGRALNDRDSAASERVAVVSERTAQVLFDSTDVVGRSIFVRRRQVAGEPEPPIKSVTIVGVAGEPSGGGGPTDPHRAGQGIGAIYIPLSQHYEGNLVFTARTPGDPATLVTAIRQALATADPDLVVTQAGTGAAIAGPSNMFFQVTAGLTGILGSLALALALAGLYGALSHVVLRRRREIGLRMALGADRRDILRLVLRDGLRPVITGIVLGLVIGAIARLWMTPLFERLIPALDPFVLTVVPLLLLACGALACLIPARRASSVDPNLALRDL